MTGNENLKPNKVIDDKYTYKLPPKKEEAAYFDIAKQKLQKSLFALKSKEKEFKISNDPQSANYPLESLWVLAIDPSGKKELDNIVLNHIDADNNGGISVDELANYYYQADNSSLDSKFYPNMNFRDGVVSFNDTDSYNTLIYKEYMHKELETSNLDEETKSHARKNLDDASFAVTSAFRLYSSTGIYNLQKLSHDKMHSQGDFNITALTGNYIKTKELFSKDEAKKLIFSDLALGNVGYYSKKRRVLTKETAQIKEVTQKDNFYTVQYTETKEYINSDKKNKVYTDEINFYQTNDVVDAYTQEQEEVFNSLKELLTKEKLEKIYSEIDFNDTQKIKTILKSLHTELNDVFGTSVEKVELFNDTGYGALAIYKPGRKKESIEVFAGVFKMLHKEAVESGVNKDESKKLLTNQFIATLVHEFWHSKQVSFALDDSKKYEFIKKGQKVLDPDESTVLFGSSIGYQKSMIEAESYEIDARILDYLNNL